MKPIQLLKIKVDDIKISNKVEREKLALSSLQTILHDDVMANIDVSINVPFVYRKEGSLYAFTQLLILLDDKKKLYALPEYLHVIEMEGTSKEIITAAQNYCLGILAYQYTHTSLYPFIHATFSLYPWDTKVNTWNISIKSEEGMAKAMRCGRSAVRTMKNNWGASQCVTLSINCKS